MGIRNLLVGSFGFLTLASVVVIPTQMGSIGQSPSSSDLTGVISPTTLDPTGKTIPDTNYPIPSSAVFMATNGSDSNAGTQASPVATLNRAVALTPSGGTLVMRGGVYHDWYHNSDGSNYGIISKPLTIQAYPHEQVWLDGTDVQPASKWTSDGQGHWSMDWTTSSFCNGGYYSYPYAAQNKDNSGPCAHWDVVDDPAVPTAGDPQMEFVNGVASPEVASLSQATNGAFYYDQANRRLWISTDPSKSSIAMATRPVAMVFGGTATATIRGIGVRRYATNEYSNTTESALYVSAPNSTVEDSVVTENAGGGLYLQARGGEMISNALVHNGFDGAGSNGHWHSDQQPDGLLIADNLVAYNDTENFGTKCSASCGSSGIKIAHMDGFTAQDNIFLGNIGNGFWCDEACSNGVIVRNVAENNTQEGLFYEVSNTGVIASNLAIHNGKVGIMVGSANTYVWNNTVVADTGSGERAFWVYDDSRSNTTSNDVGPDTTNVSLENNVSESQYYGLIASGSGAGGATPPGGAADSLFSHLDYNSYFQANAGSIGYIHWVVDNGTWINYTSMAAAYTAKGIEQHGLGVTTMPAGSAYPDPYFVNAAGGDFRLRSDSPSKGTGTTIPTPVLTALGLSSSPSSVDRGALSWVGMPGSVVTPPTGTLTPTPTPTHTPTPTPTPTPSPTSSSPTITPPSSPSSSPSNPSSTPPVVTPPPSTSSTPAPPVSTPPAPPVVKAPAVSSLSAHGGTVAGGTSVTLRGSNLSTVTSVRFGSAGAHFTRVSAKELRATSPAHSAGKVQVTAASSTGTSGANAATSFIYSYPRPVVTALSRHYAHDHGGGTLTVYGRNFLGGVSVYFGTHRSPKVRVLSSTRLSVIVPSHGTYSVHVNVHTPGGVTKPGRSNAIRYSR